MLKERYNELEIMYDKFKERFDLYAEEESRKIHAADSYKHFAYCVYEVDYNGIVTIKRRYSQNIIKYNVRIDSYEFTDTFRTNTQILKGIMRSVEKARIDMGWE